MNFNRKSLQMMILEVVSQHFTIERYICGQACAPMTVAGFVPHLQKGHELFLLVSSHVLMQSLWTVWEQPSRWRCSGSTRFWHMRHSLRVSTLNTCGGWATVPEPSFLASLSPTCTTSSSMDMPASVPRELFTCWSNDFS